MLSLLHIRRTWLLPAAVVLVLSGVGLAAWALTTRDGGDRRGVPAVEQGSTSTPVAGRTPSDGTPSAHPSPASVPTAELPAGRTPAVAAWAPVGVAALDATYTLRPERASAAGIKPDTAFVIESLAADLDPATLSRRLRIEPAVEFTTSGGPSALTVRPAAPLRESQAYRFTLLDADGVAVLRTWAFQTEGPLRIVQALPRDQSSTVPLDTGIEITFSHDGVTGVDRRFSITPAVPGRFETHKRVVVFVPQQLSPQTLYTVRIAAGVEVPGSDLRTADDYTFSFETAAAGGGSPPSTYQNVAFPRLVYESATSEAPVLQVVAYNQPPSLALPFEIYRFSDDAAFIQAVRDADAVPRWSYYARFDWRVDASALKRVASFTGDVVQPSPQSYERFVAFPRKLDEGYYLVQTSFEGRTLQSLLQVTDLATYTSVTTTKTLVWVNDLGSGNPVQGASVIDDDGRTATTGKDGVAFFDTAPTPASDPASPGASIGSQPRPHIIVVRHGDAAAVVPLGTAPIGLYGFAPGYYGGYYDYGASGDYWSYIYTDRQLYRRSDEIKVWGVARRREGFTPGESLDIRLTGGGYVDFNYQPAVVAETSVTVSDLGTFEGALPFQGLDPGGYQLVVFAGGKSIAYAYVTVRDFVKPAYKIDVVASRRAVVAGDDVTFDVTTQFFDGSPVPYVDLTYTGPEGYLQQPLRTDADGRATVAYRAAANPIFGVQAREVNARPTGPEESEINGAGRLFVLPSSLTIDAQSDVAAGDATIAGHVHHVDLSKFERSSRTYPDYREFEGAPAASQRVSAAVTEVTYTQVETGEHYDFIRKKVVKEYRYDTVERDLGTSTIGTDAAGAFTLDLGVEKGKSYRIALTVVDDDGRATVTQAFVSGDAVPYGNIYEDRLHFGEAGAPGGAGYVPPHTWSIGDSVELRMSRAGSDAETGNDVRYLFLRAQQGARDYTVGDSPRFGFDFTDDDVPNVVFYGVQFNGRGYEAAVGPYTAGFRDRDRELSVSVTADRAGYEPGASVTLNVETRGPDGAAVPAEVVISAVDEAIFRVPGYYDYQGDILDGLYQYVSAGVIDTYAPSYTNVETIGIPGPNTGGGTIGGPDTGPGAAPRSDFRDLATFRTVRTGADGRATTTFALPDNITSWRVTSRAVTAGLYAGSSVTAIPVGLPFFVDVTASDEYLTADRPVISLRAFGRALHAGDAVEYRVSVPSLGVQGATVSGVAFQRAEYTLPELAEGEHAITVEAHAAGLDDAVVRTVTVVRSRLRRAESRFYALAPGTALEGSSDARTRVVFTDHNRGRYFSDLLRFAWPSGDRVDQMLARELARDLLRQNFADGPGIEESSFDATLYQTDRGGIALFPYADDDLVLSARVASIAPDRFGRNGLARYFQAVLDDPDETRERSIVALFGLASLGEPVLPSIERIAAVPDLSTRERLYVGLAALAAGDDAAAHDQYAQVMLAYGEHRDPYVRVRVGVDQDDILEATALAADLAAGLGDPLAPQLHAYTVDNATTDQLVELDQISYLERAIPRLPSEPVRFSYVLRGRRYEQELSAGRSFALSLTPAELAALDPRTIAGDVGIATSFDAPFDSASARVDSDIAVSRTIDAGSDGVVSDGEIVAVRLDYTLAPQALDGCYQITDLVPSGLRAVTNSSRTWDYMEAISPYEVEGQRVKFCVYRADRYRPAVYFARVVNKGSYLAEPAIIQSQRSAQSLNLTLSSRVEIR
jgi:hypothetical protein